LLTKIKKIRGKKVKILAKAQGRKENIKSLKIFVRMIFLIYY